MPESLMETSFYGPNFLKHNQWYRVSKPLNLGFEANQILNVTQYFRRNLLLLKIASKYFLIHQNN